MALSFLVLSVFVSADIETDEDGVLVLDDTNLDKALAVSFRFVKYLLPTLKEKHFYDI